MSGKYTKLKQHGGKRKGEGRKKKEPTKVIRVPISKLDEIYSIIERRKETNKEAKEGVG